MLDFKDLLSAKYELGARGPDKYDCYGLCKEMYKRIGKEIPEYESVSGFENIANKVKEERKNWKVVTEQDAARTIKNAFGDIHIKPHCLIVLRMGQFGCHIGFILNELQFIHCWDRADNVIIERIDYWKHNILGAYDYE